LAAKIVFIYTPKNFPLCIIPVNDFHLKLIASGYNFTKLQIIDSSARSQIGNPMRAVQHLAGVHRFMVVVSAQVDQLIANNTFGRAFIHVVALLMAANVVLSAEALEAEHAVVRLIRRVRRLMPLQVPGINKTLWTEPASVGFVLCVEAHVSLQAVLSLERLEAERTRELLGTAVRPLMTPHVARSAKALFTYIALMLLSTSAVDILYMGVQAAPVLETLVADAANVLFGLVNVRQDVVLQELAIKEGLSAFLALENLLFKNQVFTLHLLLVVFSFSAFNQVFMIRNIMDVIHVHYQGLWKVVLVRFVGGLICVLMMMR